MKNVTGSLLALLAVVSLALSVPVSANPQDHAKAGDVKKGEAKKPTKPKGPTASQGSNPGQPSPTGQAGQGDVKKAGTGDEG